MREWDPLTTYRLERYCALPKLTRHCMALHRRDVALLVLG